MSKMTYTIVKHDGGWAYNANGTFSERFKTHERPARPPARRPRTGHPRGTHPHHLGRQRRTLAQGIHRRHDGPRPASRAERAATATGPRAQPSRVCRPPPPQGDRIDTDLDDVGQVLTFGGVKVCRSTAMARAVFGDTG